MNSLYWFAALSVVWYGLLLLALNRQWFSRFHRGFLLTLLVSLISTGVGATALMALWNYHAATQILTEQTDHHLQNIGRMVELEIDQTVALALERMRNTAGALAPHLAARDAAAADRALAAIRQSDPLLLAADLYGPDARPLTRPRAEEAHEPVRVAVAFGLEGNAFRRGPYYSEAFQKNILLLAVPVLSEEKKPVGVFTARFDLQSSLEGRFSTVRFGSSGTGAITNSRGVIIAHSDPSRMRDNISAYTAVQRALSGERGFLLDRNKKGETRLFFYRPLQSPGSLGSENLALLIEMRQDEAAAPARRLLRQFLFGGVIVLLGALVLGAQASGYIRRPLAELAAVMRRIREGDLSARFGRAGRDELGQLEAAMNDMAAGLEERDRVKELFGRYVTTQVSEQVLKGQVNLGGELRRVTILFSDIRDFTTLSEQMSPQQVVSFLNYYFSEMVEAVFQYGGVLDKFIGDGMMAVFGSFGTEPDHAQHAVKAALRMKALLAKINGERSVAGQPPIRIGIGVHTDDVIVGNIGSRKRLEYTVIGDGVNTTSRVEGLNKEFGTTVLITETTYEEVKDAFDCQLMPEARLKGKTRTIRFYEVRSARTAEAQHA